MASDLESSSFQKRPAYRYIRASDKLPVRNECRNDPTAWVKLFNPAGIGTWYLAEYDPATRTAYGLCVLQEAELGYVSMQELVAFRGANRAGHFAHRHPLQGAAQCQLGLGQR